MTEPVKLDQNIIDKIDTAFNKVAVPEPVKVPEPVTAPDVVTEPVRVVEPVKDPEPVTKTAELDVDAIIAKVSEKFMTELDAVKAKNIELEADLLKGTGRKSNVVEPQVDTKPTIEQISKHYRENVEYRNSVDQAFFDKLLVR